MSPRALTLALIASTTLNVFAVAGIAAVLVTRAKVDERIEAQNRPARGVGVMSVVEGLSEPSRDRARQALRESALAARPDFEQSRARRREAIDRAGAAVFDEAAVAGLLAQSREAELRGRARLETDAVILLRGLEADERAALAPVLLSRRQRRDAPPPQSPPPPSPRAE